MESSSNVNNPAIAVMIRAAYQEIGDRTSMVIRSRIGDLGRIEQQIQVVEQFRLTVAERRNSISHEEVSNIEDGLRNMSEALQNVLRRSDGSGEAMQIATSYTVYTGRPGRPRMELNPTILSTGLGLRGPTHLAPVFETCSRTVRRRALDYEIVEPCPPVYVTYEDPQTGQMMRFYRSSTAPMSDISDDDLDRVMCHILEVFPNFGRTMITGHIRYLGHHVSRERIRASYERVVGLPAGLTARLVGRRAYRVAGPNALWHHDGQHGLIRWRIVTHGFVDGDTRLVTGIRAHDNNRAETVLTLFHDARVVHGTPSRVRGDHGVENLLVAEFMEASFGSDRGSYIWGRSVHNIRIERLWRDVTRGFGAKWKNFFQDLEVNHGLDPNNDAHIWLLHYLFLPMINQDALEWAEAWNSHNLREEGGRERSPHDRFFFGQIQNGVRDMVHDNLSTDDLAWYGIDWEEMEDPQIMAHHYEHNASDVDLEDMSENPFRTTNQPHHLNQVDVPRFQCPFNAEQAALFHETVTQIPGYSSRNMADQRSVWTEALELCVVLCTEESQPATSGSGSLPS